MKCNHCGQIINKPESYFYYKRNKGYEVFYCSKKCQIAHMKENAFKVKCTNCGKEFRPDCKKPNGANYFCSRSCAATYNNHFRIHTEEQSKKKSESLKQYHILHPQLIKKKKEKIKKICPICNKEFFVWPSQNKTYCSRQCYYNDHQHKFRKIGEGGLRVGSGRGKKGWYKGYQCDSSWQLAFIIYNLEHDIKFERNKEGFEYLINKQKHQFYPDFILQNGTYVQIKGIMDDKNKIKITSFNKPLLVLDKESIKPYLEYVTSKYGTDFIKLYEGNPHNLKKNKCVMCGAPCKNVCCSRVCIGKYRVKQRNLKKKQENI